MPHKHTRRRSGDGTEFDLAPSQIAKPLSAFEKTSKSWRKGKQEKQSQATKRKHDAPGIYKEDDTPREFARLMQMQAGKRQRSGLDDGESARSRKKRQKTGATNESKAPHPEKAAANIEPLKILPGERLGDFAARVNQALPVSGLSRKSKTLDGSKERQTKTEKRLHRMYAEWREEDAKRKEKLEELQEQQEEEDDEKEAELGGQHIHLAAPGRKAKRKRLVGEIDGDDEDPWAVLKTKREVPKGLHDVAQAPPTINAIPKEKFKIRNGAKVEVENVPGASGSLKRREELGAARKDVIERYRAIMKGKGGL